MKKFAALFLGILISVPAALSAGVRFGSTAARKPLFGAISAQDALDVQAQLGFIGEGSGLSPALLSTLKRLDANIPEQRALLAPINDALTNFYPPSEENYEAQAVMHAIGKLERKMKESIAAAQAPDATAAQLDQAKSELEQLRTWMPLYRPQDVQALETASAQARDRFNEALGMEMAAAMKRMAQGLGAPESAAAELPVQAAEKTEADEPAQLAYVQGLVNEMVSVGSVDYALQTIAALEDIAKATSYESVEEAVIVGILDENALRLHYRYGESALAAAERIAVRSRSQLVKLRALHRIFQFSKRFDVDQLAKAVKQISAGLVASS